MNINAVEMIKLNKEMKFKAAAPAPTTPATEPTVATPQTGMKALELQGMNNISFQGGKMLQVLKKPALKTMIALSMLAGTAASTTSCVLSVSQEVVVDMNETVQKIYDALIAQGKSMEMIVQLLVQNNKDNAEIIALLQGLGMDMGTITSLLKDANAKLGDMFVLMGNMNLEQQEQTEVLDQLAADNKEFRSYLENIWAAQKEGIKLSEKQIDILNNILANQIEYGDNAEVKALLNLISAKLSESIAQDKELSEQEQAKMDTVLMYIAAVGYDMNVNQSAILQQLLASNGKQDEIIDILNKQTQIIEANGEQGKLYAEQIMQYIAAVGFDMNMRLSELLDAVNNGVVKLDEAIDWLKSINKLVAEADGSNGNVTVDLSEIEKMLEQSIQLNNQTNGMLADMIKQNDVLIGIVKAFKAEAAEYNQEIADYFQEVIDGLKNEGKCDVDFDSLMQKLDAILEAIKNHKCECDCNGDGSNEGIIGGLDDLLQ